MNKIESLLKRLNRIVVVERTEQEEKGKRGECFNIFQILQLSRNEVRLHSAFLAELLNPQANHGMGSKFLHSFLNIIDHSFDFDIESAQVKVEHFIGNLSEDYTYGGRIDLLIQDKNRQTIIIENKIDAADQPCQLYRYNRYAVEDLHLTGKNYKLLYLTPNGTEPNDSSLNGGNFEYLKISYRYEILKWLDDCLRFAVLRPLVRETIIQYINNLKDILDIMDETNNNNFLNILTSEDNIETTLTILSKNWEIQNRIREKFINQIQKLCNDFDYNFECDENVRTASNDNWIHIYDRKYPDIEFRIGVISHTESDGYRMCFVSKSHRKYIGEHRFWTDGKEPEEEYPFGWTYLWSETGKEFSGRWWRWDDLNTLKDMINEKMLDFISKQIKRIKEENVFEKMNGLLK